MWCLALYSGVIKCLKIYVNIYKYGGEMNYDIPGMNLIECVLKIAV